ncbi:MAG: tRNA1(Val) (adenine(37)-N6)-methyltransferase [bacterium]|nr:tRNA1(Val) (adenine(37)-N6)-methyltransferase [bacterium]
MIVKNKLLNYSDMVIYQNNEWFAFSLDSVLLADFVVLTNTEKNIIDLCCGNAPIGMLLSKRTNANIVSVEIQKEICDLANKSIKENNLEKQIKIINEDINKLNYNSDTFDIVTVNPPYFKNEVKLNANTIKSIARHEIKVSLDDIFKITKKILKNGGKFYMVHRVSRLLEILDKMRIYNLEPKELKFVYSKVNSDSEIVLIKGIKSGKPGMKVSSFVVVHNEDGSYCDEIRRMYG